MKTAKLFKVILSLVMVLSLLVACTPAAEDNDNPGGNNGPAQLEGLENEEYLQQLIENDLDAALVSFGEIYDKILEGMGNGTATNMAVGGKTDLTLTVSKTLRDMLEQAIFGGDVPEINFDFLSKINLSTDVGVDGDMQKMQLVLGLNGQKIVTVNALMNMAEYIIYANAPELNDGWIVFDGSEMMSGTPATGAVNSAAMVGALAEALPDAETLTKVINRYMKLVLPELKNVDQTTTTLSVDGVQQECTQLTLKIYEADALAIVKAVLTAAKDDTDLKKIIEDASEAVAEMSGMEANGAEAYADFKETVTNLLASLEDVEETDPTNPIIVTLYVDKNHKVIGGMLKMSEQDSDRGLFYFYSLTDGNKTAFEAAIPSDVGSGDDFKISGSATKTGDKTNGTYKITISGKQYITLEVKDLNAESGTLTIKPTESMIYDLGLNALPFKDLAVQIKLNAETIELNVLSEGNTLVGLALKVTESNGPNLSIPSNATDAMDSAAMNAWANNLNIQGILNNLEAAGIPSELIDAVINSIGGGAQEAQSAPAYSNSAA